jgi:mannose-6-phosphate isomerase-like protein (cupin superfamily)
MSDYRTNPQDHDTERLHNESPAFAPLVPVRLKPTADAVTDTYRNFVLSQVNDHCVRMAVMQGEYRWHRHPRSDETFLVLEGCLTIDLAGGQTIVLHPGEMFTIPAKTVHRTRASVRTVNVCFERSDAYTDVEFTTG